jgi:hypothetical protein
MKSRARPTHQSDDGTVWRVDVQNPSSSHALVVFRHPDPRRTRESRYAHYVWQGPESQNVASRIDVKAVIELLDAPMLARLFSRSFAIAGRPAVAGRVV